MSDAQKLIADVLRKHRIAYLDQFICSFCGTTFGSLHDADAHQAAEIDKALGGLTRITQPEYPARWDAGVKICDAGRLVSRWVSGWSGQSHE